MFRKKCFCKENISKIVRPLLATVSVNGLTISQNEQLPQMKSIHALLSNYFGNCRNIQGTFLIGTVRKHEWFNPYAAGVYFGHYKMMQKT